MGENNGLTTALVVGGVVVVGYFLFKDRIGAFFDRLGEAGQEGLNQAGSTLINIGSEAGIIPAGTNTIIKTYDFVSKNNIIPYVENVATSIREGTVKQVKNVTGGTGTYKASTGTLKVDGQGYSVSAVNAPAMAKQVYKAPSSNINTIQSVYKNVKVNPYSK